MKFTYLNRQSTIKSLKTEQFDLVIIGGGITGAGLAMQAAASHLKVALIEMQDFSQGTSSRSTKLVHGGIRYLKQFDVEVVAETVAERAIIQQIAPHLPKPEMMLLPIYDEEGATFTLFRLGVAMELYDSLAGIDETSPYANRILSKEEVLQIQPDISQEGLLGGGLYLDYTSKDSRLVIENIKQAVKDGAIAVPRLKAKAFNYDTKGQIASVEVEDLLTNDCFSIEGKVFVNTTGPWSDQVREWDSSDQKPAQMRPTKGVHLVVDRSKLAVSQPTYFDSGQEDGRMVFVIPREDKTYFGTTDTDYEGDLMDPKVDQSDVDYLLGVINHRFPEATLEQADIESSWAGLRPLISSNHSSDYNGGNNGSLSNEHFDNLVRSVQDYVVGKKTRQEVERTVFEMEQQRSEAILSPSQISRGSDLWLSPAGLITVAGGKLTDYRKMAEGAMKEIKKYFTDLGRPFELINSKTYPVSGGSFNPYQVEESMERFAKIGRLKGLSHDAALDLAWLYGSNTERVLDYIEEAKNYADRYNYPLETAVSLIYAIEHEAVYTISDYLTRRTAYSLFNCQEVNQILTGVAKTLQGKFLLSKEEMEQQMAQYELERSEQSLGKL
ncbi:type 1 glycerol-3-phosphate oxidase [Facklamia sp. DSM 111018]|uniref:Alpha-glycerophosphate oxidase n=1 Tax=Facklamia lactis TaxID=2749967 RepID=A0ABS0LNM3_9LACT|nr:type 1 glycerol-3-phosphate oxidase [Facklamia lactis]MBG9985703.1 type 1 glycerol-3-phosphate oxidase [Facklamia lactis]